MIADLRALLILLEAPFAGAVLMLAIGRVTGGDWAPLASLARAAWILPVIGLLIGLTDLPAKAPAVAAWWQNGWLAALRGAICGGLLAFAGRRILDGASASFAAIALTLYVVLVTPIAFDWLIGGTPGHTVSSAGMMLAVIQIGAACATTLLGNSGSGRERQDLAKFLVAAALGLSYLAYMDYVITWYGNLPSRVGYYGARGTPVMAGLAAAALVVGLFGTIAALATGRQRLGGGAALAGLTLFLCWWTTAHWLLALVLIAAGALVPTAMRRRAHG